MSKLIKEAVFLTAFATWSTHAFKISISHCNDISGQVDGFENGTHTSGVLPPTPCFHNPLECTGGLPSVIHWLYESVPDFEDVKTNNNLRFMAGSMIGGESGWIRALGDGWAQFGTMVSYAEAHAMTLGVKEFGGGLKETLRYMNSFPNAAFTLANTCHGVYANTTDEYNFCNKNVKFGSPVKEVTVLNDDKKNYTIGVIGFVSSLVERLSLPGKLEFADVATKIKEAVDSNKANIKTFIAVGDGSLEQAQQIIDTVPQVKLVIYGAGFSTTKNMTGNYPESHKESYIATAGRYGESVGKMVLDIDETTGAVKVLNSTLVNTTYPEKPHAQAHKATYDKATKWYPTIRKKQETNAGFTRVHLEGGEICWHQECALGNLMADAVVNCVVKNFTGPFKSSLFSLWHGGAFHRDTLRRDSNINHLDIYKWLPYPNDIHFVKVNGSNLRRVFEVSAASLEAGKNGTENFLQVSRGLQVFYNTESDTGGPNVTRIRILHDVEGVPRLRDIRDDKDYYFAIPTYLYEGRGAYNVIKGIWQDTEFDTVTSATGLKDDYCLLQYIEFINQVSVGLEERIWINMDPEDGAGGDNSGAPTNPQLFFTLLFPITLLIGITSSFKFSLV